MKSRFSCVAHAVVVGLAFIAVTAVVHANEKEEAKTHFQNGFSMMELEDFAGAAVEFEASVAKFPTKNAMFNLGMCLKAMHKYPQALQVFRKILTQFGADLGGEMRSEVRKNIASINKMIAQVEVNTNVPGATVLVDGEAMGTTPLGQPLVIGAGEHRIRVSLAGYEDVEKTVTVVSQTRQIVEFTMAPAAGGGGAGGVPVDMDAKGALFFAPGAIAPPRPVQGSNAPPPPGSLTPPPTPPLPPIPSSDVGHTMKIYGMGVAVQAVGIAIGLSVHYGYNGTLPLITAGGLYFLGSAAAGGVVTWLYGNKNNFYDLPPWAGFLGSVAGNGLAYGVDALIWVAVMDQDSPDDVNEGMTLFSLYLIAILIPPALEAVSYAIFKKPEPRFQKAAASLEIRGPMIAPITSMDGTGRTTLGCHIIGGKF